MKSKLAFVRQPDSIPRKTAFSLRCFAAILLRLPPKTEAHSTPPVSYTHLAEKPSVAQSIAKVLGAAKREDGYLEGNGYVVSWCVGHLVELAQPEVYDAKYSKWAYADLPIFPMDWQYEVSAGTKKQFGIRCV